MSVPADALNELPPQSYEVVRPTVRSGDILLCQGRDFFSRLTSWATKSPWSHIAIAIKLPEFDRILVVEAVAKIGVRCVPLSEFLSRNSEGVTPYPGRILLTRDDALNGDAAEARVGAMCRFAFDHLGDRFATHEMVRIALRIVSARLLGPRRTPRMLLRDDEFICSEFVAEAYERAGLSIPWDGLGFIAPADFANDPRLEPLAQIDVRTPPAVRRAPDPGRPVVAAPVGNRQNRE